MSDMTAAKPDETNQQPFFQSHHSMESQQEAQNDRNGQLSPWTKKQRQKQSRRRNRLQALTTQDYRSNGRSLQMPSVRPQTRIDEKVSFRLTFNSLRTRRQSHNVYTSLDAHLGRKRQELESVKDHRTLFNTPKLMQLDYNLQSKKRVFFNAKKAHRYHPQNDKSIQLNPYHRNKKRRDKMSSFCWSNNESIQKRVRVINIEQVFKPENQSSRQSTKERAVKNMKMDRTIKSWRAQKPIHTHTRGDKFACCGELINASTLHSSNRQRLRRIAAMKDHLGNQQQHQLNAYLNQTIFSQK